MASEDLAYLSLREVARRIRERALSSRSVTEVMLDRIARIDPRLHSFHLVMGEGALAQAAAADAEIAAGRARGPLHGVPLAVKDLLFFKGVPAAAGTEVLANFVPEEDATVVTRLKAAGAVILGKLHMTEGAHLDHHPNRPQPVNSYNTAHWTGASSSGSGIAPAAGLCYGSLGTDTGGSIRMPSSACNLSGIKPTWGRVSRHGVHPLCETLDHIGPMARCVADAAAILQVIAGADPADPTALQDLVPDYEAALRRDCAGLVIGIDWDFACDGMADDVVLAMRDAARAFADLGAEVREVRMPATGTLGRDTAAMTLAEIGAAHARLFPKYAGLYGPRMHAVLTAARQLDGISVAQGYIARKRFRGALAQLLDSVDMLLMPGLGGLLPTWVEFDRMSVDMGLLSRTLLRFTMPFNLTGVPTLSVPGGFTANGVPVGLQLVGRLLSEPALLAAGHAFQQITDFHNRRPPRK